MNILWFIEHVSRELDVACCVKTIIESKSPVRVHIRHLLMDLEELLNNPDEPDIIIFPFFYNCNFNAIKQYLAKWRNAKVFNLSWEELYYTAHTVIKAPRDDFTKLSVIHHAWGDFFKQYLLHNGVIEKNIFVNGHPAYKLYEAPYNNYFKSRLDLSKEYGLSLEKRWIFIPENYKWAFLTDSRLKDAIRDGANENDVAAMKTFCLESLALLVRWCSQAISMIDDIELIFRPRPAVNSEIIRQFIVSKIGKIPSNFHIIKNDSVREWILASDVVISSYSTSLIEASIAHKNIYMALPVTLPEALWCDWYDNIEHLVDQTAFIDACRGFQKQNYVSLETWARANMLSHGDPLINLAEYLITLSRNHTTIATGHSISFTANNSRIYSNKNSYLFRLYSSIKLYMLQIETTEAVSACYWKSILFKWYRALLIFLFNLRLPIIAIKSIFEKKGGYNNYLYEKDAFSNNDIIERCEKWRRILFIPQT